MRTALATGGTSAAGGRKGRAAWLWLAASALVLASGFACLGQDVFDYRGWIWLLIGVGVLGGLLTATAARALSRQPLDRIGMLSLGVGAVVLRLLLLPASRDLSDDAYRYRWDGKVLVHGINPYAYPPNDPRLDPLRTDPLDARINHPDLTTVYPPLAQAFFAAGYWLTPGSLRGLQGLLLLCELAAWLVLWAELRRTGKPSAWLLLLMGSPLVIGETYLPAHLDALALPFVALFLACLGRQRPVGAGIALALACLIKPLALIFVPAAMAEVGWRGTWRAGAAFSVVVAAAYLPFISAGGNLFESMGLMARSWSFNGSFGAVLEALLPRAAARWAAATLLLALLILSARFGRGLHNRLLLAAVAFVVCTPTVFPWYLIGLMPLLVLAPDPALLALTILAPLAEVVVIRFHYEAVWALPLWASIAQYAPVFSLLAWRAWRGKGMFARSTETR